MSKNRTTHICPRCKWVYQYGGSYDQVAVDPNEFRPTTESLCIPCNIKRLDEEKMNEKKKTKYMSFSVCSDVMCLECGEKQCSMCNQDSWDKCIHCGSSNVTPKIDPSINDNIVFCDHRHLSEYKTIRYSKDWKIMKCDDCGDLIKHMEIKNE